MSLKDSSYNNAIDQTNYLRSKYGGDITKIGKGQVISYLKDLLLICEDGIITRSETAFLISETLWSKLVREDPKLESIAMLATMLEVPQFIEGENLNLHWAELVEKINKLHNSEGLD